MGRVAEAWRALRGRTDGQIALHDEVARVRAQWMNLQGDVLDAMDKLERAYQRIRKQNERLEKNTAPEPTQLTPATPSDRKAALRSRLYARKHGGGTPTPEQLGLVPQNANAGAQEDNP